MTNDALHLLLHDIDLGNCEHIFNGIYYIKTDLADSERYGTVSNWDYEFLIITDNNIKKAIIVNYDNLDLHWYVCDKWRGSHILSNALRTNIIKFVWPNVEYVSCPYDKYDEDSCRKYSRAVYLANLAGLKVMTKSPTCIRTYNKEKHKWVSIYEEDDE